MKFKRTRQFLGSKWKRLPIGSWLLILLAFFFGVGVLAFFFVRRDVVRYHFTHTFGVRDPEFFGSAHALADPCPLGGNQIKLLQNGDEIFPSMLKAIEAASKSINFEAYIFRSDSVGRQFRDALCKKAQAGVKVRVLVDGLGSGTGLDNSDVAMMNAKGCAFAYFHPARSWRIDRFNRRTHRRIVVIDGRIGFTGGVGFADEWQGNADREDHWRDVHARIEGPLVAKLQGAFEQHWVAETGETLSGDGQFPFLPEAGSLRVQAIASHEYSIAPLALVQAVSFAAAEEKIFITNPYCTPSKDQEEALIGAAKRGVDVRLLLPGKHNDQPATKAAGRASYGNLLKGGVKIFEYVPTMIHSKTMVVDRMFSLLGTSNLDARSSQINEEIDISVYDEAFGGQMEELFLKDLSNAKPYTLEQFENRGLWERFTEWVSGPFRKQL